MSSSNKGLFQKLTVTQLVEKFLAFYGTRNFVHTNSVT